MIHKQIIFGLGLASLLASGMTFAAPAGGPGASKGPESREMRTTTERAEHREQRREHDPEDGEQIRAQKEKAERKMESAESRGEQTAAEMQERRTERKEIQETYRKGVETGEAKAKKKPWWKFWGDDEG